MGVAEKLFAVLIAVVLLVVAACLVVELTPLNEKFVTGVASYSGFGVCVLAWRWPRIFTGPFRKMMGMK